MKGVLDQLAPLGAKALEGEFQPAARYFRAMDFLLYLSEDCTYRADRIDHFLTLLWHPNEERAVGVKLKGFRFLFERIKAILASSGHDTSDSQFLKLMTALELAMTLGLGAEITRGAERERIRTAYETAR